MRYIILILFSFSFLISCSQNLRSSYKYKCAEQLTESVINNYIENSFEDYTDEDLNFLADITTYIMDSNPEKDSYECFFNQHQKNLLVLDVYGLENEEKIDKTVCGLLENKKIKLPRTTIILFHKYINGFDDGGIIVGLKISK